MRMSFNPLSTAYGHKSEINNVLKLLFRSHGMVNEVGLKADMRSSSKQHQWYSYLKSKWGGEGKGKEANLSLYNSPFYITS